MASLAPAFPPPSHRAVILGRSNGVGLDRDAALLGEALTMAGVETLAPKLRSLRAVFSPRTRARAAFHLERVAPWWRWKAERHFLIPNQERFPERLLGRLKMIDHVLCKSRHATEIFSKHHPSVRCIGFTSEDRGMRDVLPDYGKFFHLAGKSTLKNTGVLLDLWARHPEWPVLTLVQHPDNAPASVPANVELLSGYLPDEQLRALQNRCGVHLCPSLSEGWGHYIVEAMSCRAVVVTTDAPPMNELVNASRGVVVPWERSEPRHLGTNFYVDAGKLESAIEALVTADMAEKRRLGESARAWFEENDRIFRQNIAAVVADYL